MNPRLKSVSSQKPKYQSYYFKKLQTQTSLSSNVQKGLNQTSLILQKEIEKMQKGLFQKNAMYTKTLRRKSEIEDQQQKSRSALKSRIEQKMRKSQQNMLSFRQKSNSSLSSRIKAQTRKIQQIKRLQRTVYDQKYQKSKQYSTRTQKFFSDLEQRKRKKQKQISLDTSYLVKTRKREPMFEPISTKKLRYRQSSHQRSHHNLNQNPQNIKPIFSILRTPRQTILQKQIKKTDLQKYKENSFLRDYVKKLQCIEATRKKVQIQRKVPQSTVPKFINRQIDEEEIKSKKKFSKSFIKQAVNHKGSFSQLYQKKLLQKKEKKTFFLSQSIAQGDLILKDEFKQKSKFKLNKLIRETQNELARKQNFRYMEKYLNKRF